jgi:5-methylcytosine-specific restriction protein B
MEPQFNGLWRDWCVKKFALGEADIDLIASKMTQLNDDIANDRSLGPQFRVGHSFVTPNEAVSNPDVRKWFVEIIDTELGPLLQEYWYDAPDRAREAVVSLKSGL